MFWPLVLSQGRLRLIPVKIIAKTTLKTLLKEE
jgi:hypothetical protein